MDTADETSFRKACVSVEFDADAAIEWIKENYNPVDVFGDKTIRKFVAENFAPDDVFDEKHLAEWARVNDYVKEGGAP